MAIVNLQVADLFDPAYGTVGYHDWIVTHSDTGWNAAWLTVRTYFKDITFSEAVSFDDLHMANDGNGNIVFTITSGDAALQQFTIENFEDGRAIEGLVSGIGSAMSIDVGGGDDFAIEGQAIGQDFGDFAFSGSGVFTSYSTPVSATYFLEEVTVGGVVYDLTTGVPINGTDGWDNLLGFGINDSTGLAYNDVIWGREGDDRLYGLEGDDVLRGGAGNDYLEGGAGVDTLLGGAGNDYVYSDGADLVNGGEGDDTVFLHNQAVLSGRFVGGEGVDTIRFDGATFNAASGAVTFSGFETIESGAQLNGTAGDDRLNLTGAGTVGGSGVEISAGAGKDVIIGSGGDDRIHGGDDDDQLNGGAGDDYLEGGAGSNIVRGGAGNDYVYVTGADIVDGGAGDDTVFIASGTLLRGSYAGGAGTDHLRIDSLSFDALSGAVSFSGFETFDTAVFTGTTGADRLNLSGLSVDPGNGVIIYGLDGDDVIVGSGGGDTILGGEGDDTLNGGGGDDHIQGGAGTNILRGGAGNDVIYVQGTDTVDGGAGDDSVIISNILLRGSFAGGVGTDMLQIDGATFDAGSGSIAFTGFEDIASGGGLYGTTDNDRLNLSAVGSLSGNGFYIDGGNGDDFIIGSGGADEIYGGSGDNQLNGGAGNDRLYGGTGNNIVRGGAGDDMILVQGSGVFDGSTGDDFVHITNWGVIDGSYAGGAGTDTLFFEGATFDARSALASFTGFEDIASGGGLYGTSGSDRIDLSAVGSLSGNGVAIHGFEGDDMMIGTGGADTLVGGSGHDILNGSGDADRMEGGEGDDVYHVDNAGDLVIETANQGVDSVYASVSYSLGGTHVEKLILTGTANIDATGNGLVNEVIGNDGDNIIDGGAGSDVLRGRGGADQFRFSTALASNNVDRIADFNVADDSIGLASKTFAGAGPAGVLEEAAFHVGVQATDAAQRILYDAATGALFYDADGSGAGAAILFARVEAGLAMTHADFLIV